MDRKKMLIIGAGAAGLMTAIHAAERYDVTVLEKNDRTGKKLYITGKGRCNLTNNCSGEAFMSQVVSNARFLFPASRAYPPERVMADFESWGLKIKTERGNRVFPISDHSSDVIRTLTEEAKRKGAEIRLQTEVKALLTEGLSVNGVLLFDGTRLSADVVVLATGGISYSSTGSTGDGHLFLKDLGLSVTELYPSLVPLETKETVVKDWAGLSLKNVEAKLIALKNPAWGLKKDKELGREFGEMLFTHSGVSGPVILTLSTKLALFKKQKKLRPDQKSGFLLSLDLKPALSGDMIISRLKREKESMGEKTLASLVRGYLPKTMTEEFLRRASLSENKKISAMTEEEEDRFIMVMKDFRFSVSGTRGFQEAIITSGGLSTREVDPRTMQVKKTPGLRVAGELLDLDAVTGGFNLQIAWCTAYLAAQ